MKPDLSVEIPQNNSTIKYPIYIEKCSISETVNEIKSLTQNQKKLVIINETVYRLYKTELNFNKSEIFILKDGEEQKNLKNFEKIIKQAIKLNLSRKDTIIAIGGGVAGDLAGFVAATYMRGIHYIQVPTTLLSAVDSSVGGKTAIDVCNNKNYIGAFYQPDMVFININFLKTLDYTQMQSGLGEVLKYSFIEISCNNDNSTYLLMELLSVAAEKIYLKNISILERIITLCLKLKIAVVTQDEKENGLRKILNFGHTFGHALETLTNFNKYTHGEAVVYGMMFAFDYALKKNLINKSYYDLAYKLFDEYNYKKIQITGKTLKKIINIMKYDKKSSSGKIVMILPDKKATVKEYEINNDNDLI